MFQVSDSRVLESLHLVIHKRTDRAAQRNYDNCGRRLEARNHADQIADQDKKAQRNKERREALTVVAYDFAALSVDNPVGNLEDVLQGSRTADREPRANPG